MTKKIYMTRPIHQAGISMLEEKGYSVTMGPAGDTPSHESIIEALKQQEYDAVVPFLTDKVDASLFATCPTAKVFSNYAVGFNNINFDDARSFGIAVSNTPGTSGQAVAEHTVALTLAVMARIAEGDAYMRSGKYVGWQPDLLLGTDLSGKTIGMLGLGDIGIRAAKMFAKGFGCKIIYTDIVACPSLEAECDAKLVTKEELLRGADVVSLHVPLLPSTTHLLDAEAFSVMKSDAIVINTARGPVIDEQALVSALTDKKIRGAGIDVYEFEPRVSEGLLALPNVVLNPHIASSRESVRSAMSETVAKNLISFFETGSVINSVLK
jgi:glyoxylate reductase